MANALYRTITGQSQKSDHSSQPTPISKISTTDPLTGTLNHLTEHQHELLVLFKEKLQKDGWWTAEGINGKPSHDDGTLLRYLRARKFDINGACGQFTDTEKWFKENRVEELYEHFDVEFYEKARGMYPQWIGHRDRRGIPIYVYVIKHLDSKNVSKYEKQSKEYKAKLPHHKGLPTTAKLLPLFALYHNLLNFVMPLCSSLERPNPEIPITTSTNIVDVSNVGLAQFWNLKAHMQEASVLATAHYPETLDRIFIIGAPSFFPTVWGWVKRWFDPVTVSKIFILGKHEVKPTLMRFMEEQDIPTKYGGKLQWEFGDLPSVDEPTLTALEKDGTKGWVRGPALWLDHRRVTVGSENGRLRRDDSEIAALKPVVYAADDTEEPVHPERRASSLSGPSKPPSRKSHADTNGSPWKHKMEAGAGITAAAATGMAAEHAHKRPATPTRQVSPEDLRKSPIGGSPLYLAKQQPAVPAQTAEYLSSGESLAQPPPEKAAAPPTSAPTEELSEKPLPPPAAAPPAQTTSTAAHPPPGITQPGPLSKYQAQMSNAVAAKMEGESVSIIPPSANGALSHPEIIMASDYSKGLAMETEKLNLNGTAKPPMERFVTAVEF